MAEPKCEFCAWAFDEDDDDDFENLLELPLTIGDNKYDIEIGQFHIWIDHDGQLSAGLLCPTYSDYINILKKKLNFCPICGRDFRLYRKEGEAE